MVDGFSRYSKGYLEKTLDPGEDDREGGGGGGRGLITRLAVQPMRSITPIRLQ